MRKLATLTFLMMSVSLSYAQIKHTDVVPVRVIKGPASASRPLDSVILHLAHPLGTIIGKDSALVIWHFDPPPPASNDVGFDCRGMDAEALYLSTQIPTQVAAIDSGMMIDANAGTWDRPNYERLALEKVPNENWDNKTDKYIGVRFKRGANWHYGWIKMSIDGGPDKAELKGYAYEQTANKGIVAGAKGTPTSGVAHFELRNVDIRIKDKFLQISGIEGKYNLIVVDLAGRVVRNVVPGGYYEADMSDLAGGIYIVKIEQNGQLLSYKINLQ